MENGAIFDPQDKSLVVSVRAVDVSVIPDEDGWLTIAISNLKDGIEIVHGDRRLWWPI